MAARPYLPSPRWLRTAGPALALAGMALTAPSPALAKPAPGEVRRSDAPPQRTWYPRASLRSPGTVELAEFLGELERAGWKGAALATIPTHYVQTGSGISPVGRQPAAAYGDLDGDGHGEWVVGCYLSEAGGPGGSSPSGAGESSSRSEERARLAVFRQEPGGRWRLAWRSPGLGYEFGVPTYNIEEAANGLGAMENLRPPLALVDIDGDRREEIAYSCWSGSPHVDPMPGIYRFESGRWVDVAPQADRFSLQDVNRDGKMELVTGSPFVGYGSGDDDVPRVWRWSGRRYEDASADFPAFYADLTARYEAHLRAMTRKGTTFDRAMWTRAIRKASSLAGPLGLHQSAGTADKPSRVQ
jgi:hypothetical protein